jgi:hypothetical protein
MEQNSKGQQPELVEVKLLEKHALCGLVFGHVSDATA